MSKRSYSQPFGFSTEYMSQAMKRPKLVLRGPMKRVSKRRSVKGLDAAVKRSMLKAVEPKYSLWSIYGASVGQTNGAAAGGQHVAHTVYPDRGTGQDQRVGNRITVTGLTLGISAWLQSVISSDVTIVTRVCKFDGTDPVTDFSIGEYINSNEAIQDATTALLGAGTYAVFDNTSVRNPLYKDSYSTIKEIVTHIPARSIDGGNAPNVQNPVYVPMNLELEFNGTSGNPTNSAIVFVTTASCGNKSVATASTWAGMSTVLASTGTLFNINAKLHFKDL